MNKVILMGRLTRDPEIRYAQDNSLPVARFTLAVDRRFKRDNSQQTADFINCVAFGKTAEFLEKYARKGTKFVVEGRIQTGSYTNKDGQKVYTTDVVCENVEFAESKKWNLQKARMLLPIPDIRLRRSSRRQHLHRLHHHHRWKPQAKDL